MFHEIVELLEGGKWTIEFDLEMESSGVVVEALGNGIIYINPLWDDRVLTLIHECIHILCPEKSEDKVEKKTRAVYRSLTLTQEYTLLFLIQYLRW